MFSIPFFGQISTIHAQSQLKTFAFSPGVMKIAPTYWENNSNENLLCVFVSFFHSRCLTHQDPFAAVWSETPAAAIVKNRQVTLADFDMEEVPLRNYMVDRYFSILELDFNVFQQVWQDAYVANPHLVPDLVCVAAAGKFVETNWNPKGVGSVLAAAQTNHRRDAGADSFKYGEVAAALLTAMLDKPVEPKAPRTC